ncbi:MAG: NAD(P)/FAD-dependent oxidoreductase [Gemmatimonadota bacterium]
MTDRAPSGGTMPVGETRSFDAVVIGAGPAGCLAARQLALEGASVLLLEREEVPRWKVCGACVGVGALSVLEDVGLGSLPAKCGAVPLDELVIEAPGRRTPHSLSPGRRASVRLRGGVAWSRAAMDEALFREAEREGATCWTGAYARVGPVAEGRRSVRIRRGGAEIVVQASVVLDAAGLRGAPRVEGRRSGSAAGGSVREDARVGLGAVLRKGTLSAVGLPAGRIHMVVGRAGYVGIVRLEDGSLDVAAAVDPEALRGASPGEAVDDLLDAAGLRLEGAASHGWRGTPPLTRLPSRVCEPHLFRIGDAMGYVEPFTGEGMGWALASARAVAPLALHGIERWDTPLERAWEDYQAGQSQGARRLCRAVSWGLRHPTLVDGVLALLARAPGLAAPWVRRAGRVPAVPSAHRSAGAAFPRAREGTAA